MLSTGGTRVVSCSNDSHCEVGPEKNIIFIFLGKATEKISVCLKRF